MDIDFEIMKNMYEAIENASDTYEVKSFKPWKSDGGREHITIVLTKKTD